MLKLDQKIREIIAAITGDDNPEKTYLESYLESWQNMLNRFQEDGYRRGFVQGYKAGAADEKEKFEVLEESDAYQQGYTCGYDDGARENDNSTDAYDQGYKSGHSFGYEQGHELGHRSGYKTGYDKGIREGMELEAMENPAEIIPGWNTQNEFLKEIPQAFDDIPTEKGEFRAQVEIVLQDGSLSDQEKFYQIIHVFEEWE